MFTTARFHVVLFIAATVVVSAPRTGFAIAGNMPSAGNVSFSSDYPEDAQKQVQSVLEQKDCKFLGGIFVNWHSTISYDGDVPSLNRFLDGLANCPATEVTVAFKKIDQACHWRVSHDGSANSFHVVVNLKSIRLDLEQLVIPAARGAVIGSSP